MCIWVICREMGLIESSMEGVCAELDATGAYSILDDGGEMVWFTRMGIHLGLLGDSSGLEFLMRSNGWDFDGGLVWSKLERIVDVGLMCKARWRGDERAGSTVGTEGSVEGNIQGKFMNGKSGKNSLDGVVVSAR